MAEHKGFEATAKKLKEARKQGQVLKSPIFTQTCAVISVFLCLFNGLGSVWIRNGQMLEWCLSVPTERLMPCSIEFGSQCLWVVLGSLSVTALVVVLVEVLQVRFEFVWDPVSPKIDRLDLVKGLTRIKQGIGKCWLIFLKLIFVLFLARFLIWDFVGPVQNSLLISDSNWPSLLGNVVRLAYFYSAILLMCAAAEYLFNRKRFQAEQSMSQDEVRREFKEDEGDPHVKSHRKALHEAMITQELVKRVRGSKVIIVE